ncbi:uncharacterized protein LOC131670941 isoform X2 [Phymastichus coffea]|nr:uncharacterized protein LOC131670941 isoform X2 [Phymastichus coffea]
MANSIDDDFTLYLESDVEDQISLINNDENSNEDHVNDLNVNGIEFDDKFIENWLNYYENGDVESYIELNKYNKIGLFIDLSLQKEIDNNSNNYTNMQLKIVPRESLPTNFEAQHKSKYLIQNNLIDTFENSIKHPMNPRVVLKKPFISFAKPKRQVKVTDAKSSTIKRKKAMYRCSGCCFKTDKRIKMIYHLDETSHESVYYKKQVISNGQVKSLDQCQSRFQFFKIMLQKSFIFTGNFYSIKHRKINNNYKTKSNVHYQLRNKYSSEWFHCSYNKCQFSAKNWRLMYNHMKYSHLQPYKLKKKQIKYRIKCKDILMNAKRNSKLEMRALVILERLPSYIVNLESPISMKLWFPCSRNISLSVNQQGKSTIEKYPCTFNNCMFVSKNWRAMHRHVKLCHVKLPKICNNCSYEGKPRDKIKDHIAKT